MKDKVKTDLPRRNDTLPSDLQYTRDSSGNIICADPRLEDPALLAAFIQHHGAKPPTLSLRITGTHWEEQSNKKRDRRQVTDFDFSIALTTEILVRRGSNAPLYFFTYLPDVPTYRGTTWKRVQSAQAEDARIEAGLSAGQFAIVQYLESDLPLKQFCFEKMVSGWDMKRLTRQVEQIAKQQYDGDVAVRLIEEDKYIYIRPASTLSNVYRHPVTFFFRCVLFPIGILLWILEMTWLGAYWQVLGAKYDLHSEHYGMSVESFLMTFHERIAEYARNGEFGIIEWTTNFTPYRDLHGIQFEPIVSPLSDQRK